MNVAAHDEYLIHLLKHTLNPNVVRLVMSRQAVPTTYTGWKTEALAMDSLEQSYRYIAKDSQPTPRTWTAPNHPPPRQPVPPTAPQPYNPPVRHQAPNPPN